MKTFIFLFFILIGFCNSSTAQKNDTGFELSLDAGYMWRSPPFKPSPAARPVYSKIFNDNKMAQGFGLNVGATLSYKPLRLGVTYNSNVRYDYIYRVTKTNEVKKDFLIDHNFSVIKYFAPRKSQKKNLLYIGGGYSIINAGKNVSYKDNYDRAQNLNFQYDAWSVFIGIPVWKIYIEPKLLFTDNYPFTPSQSNNMISIRAYYTFEIL